MTKSQPGQQLRWVIIAIVVMIIVGVFGRFRLLPPALKGKPAPDFQLPILDGGLYTLSEDTATVVVLDFWASWCGPCRVSLPRMEQLHRWAKAEQKSVAIYCINQGEEPDRILDVWQEHDLTMPVLLDTMYSVSVDYEIHAIPQTVIITNKKIVDVHIGTSNVQSLKKQIERLLD